MWHLSLTIIDFAARRISGNTLSVGSKHSHLWPHHYPKPQVDYREQVYSDMRR
jgi:hypothetical protein